MPLSRELERQAKDDIYKAIDTLIERYISEGVNIYDIERYISIKKSFKTFLNDINYAGRRYFTDEEDYPGFVKIMLKKIILDKKSEVETKKLSENTVIRFSQFLNESAIVLEGDDITAEYLFADLEYSEEDKDIIASFFKTKPEYVDSKNSKYCVYSITDFQADVLKNNRVSFDAMIISKHQIMKMKENIVKKIVSGVFTQIPEQIDYMGIRIKPHTLMEKSKLKEAVDSLVQEKQILDLITKVSSFTYVNKYGEDYYIWKKTN